VQLAEDEIRGLCLKCRGIFLEQPVLLELEAPLKICGELHTQTLLVFKIYSESTPRSVMVCSQPSLATGSVHGQYSDLLHIFEIVGFPPESSYLFLGNYVDHGRQSVETMCLLMAYKIKYPESFFLLRGNHECAAINRTGWFYDECKLHWLHRLQ